MALVAPVVIGPLTSWSRTLLIHGGVRGATVVVRESSPTGREIAKSVVAGGRDRIPLLPGINLTPGRALFAAQLESFEPSPWTSANLAELVGHPPLDWTKVPVPWFYSKVHACGMAVWVKGCVPGAVVTISSGPTQFGQGQANEGGARVQLQQPLPAGNPVVNAIQAAPPGAAPAVGSATPATVAALSLPVPPEASLPMVTVGQPMPMGCDASLVIGNVVDGAEVTIARVQEGLVQRTVFDLDRLDCILGSPLDPAGGRVEIQQAVGPRCAVAPSPPRVVGFGPAQTPPTPLPHPPCGGSCFLWIENLKGGADIRIEVGGQTYRAMAPQGQTQARFDVAPLNEGQTITVIQSNCGIASDPGTTVVTAPMAAGAPKVIGPLFKCARVVRVTGVTPGALVYLLARGAGGESTISKQVWSRSTSLAIAVSPGLVQDDEIYAVQVACGGSPRRSVTGEPVQPLPPPLPVEIAFAFSTQRAVTVVALPGALIRVFRRRHGIEEIGWGLVDPEDFRVRVSEPLVEGDYLFATQEICAISTDAGPSYQVKPGEKLFTMTPARIWPITSEPPGKDVTWLEARLRCRIAGDYEFYCRFHNAATNTNVDIDANIRLSHPSGFVFGAAAQVFLRADNSGPSYQLLEQKGYKTEDDDTDKGMQLSWRDPAQWILLLQAQAEFEWYVAPMTFPESEVDDAEESPPDQAEPPPSA